MFSENIGNDYIVIQEGTSEGTQVKYKKDGYWYKKDNRGNEGRAEYLVSKFMQFTTLQENEFISYEEGTINGKSGCRSKNFLDEEEELVTFYRLYYNEVGKDLSKVIANMNTMEERIEYVIRFIDQSCGLNIHAYLSKVLTLDMICLNEDRHLNNLALIMRGNDFYPAPIFDNGVSLLTANQSVNWNFSIEENVKRGVTGLYGKGMYSGNDKLVLICAANIGDIPRIKSIAQNIDEKCFIVVANAREVLGKGFKESN